MNVLIIGSGGREHALAWKVAQSKRVNKVYVAPGNAGTAMETKVENIAIGVNDITALSNFAQKAKIALTIVGPELPLVSGLVDVFKAAGLACFGPSKAGAILEGSKSFSKQFLKKYHIPSADYKTFTNAALAIEYVKSSTLPIVIKADGLAGGKGVTVANNLAQAISTINALLVDKQFGTASGRIVIEEFIRGEEASFIVITDGKHAVPLASSQDHKARYDNNKGPNTGGMGAYSPAPVINAAMHQLIMDKVIMPTIHGMANEGRPYVGFLYVGLMITKNNEPKVLEFNCRLGDPEAQVILTRLQDDLVVLCLQAIAGTLNNVHPSWDPRAALGIVTVAKGYPTKVMQGFPITGLDSRLPEYIKIFHAGTKNENGNIVVSGGRVLCVTGLGDSVMQAQDHAYQAIASLFGMTQNKKSKNKKLFFRKDIGYQAITRELAST